MILRGSKGVVQVGVNIFAAGQKICCINQAIILGLNQRPYDLSAWFLGLQQDLQGFLNELV